MSFHHGFLVAFLMVIPSAITADEPKLDDLLGSWELIDETAGIPKGSTFDFQKNGKLVISATTKQETKIFECGYKLKGKVLEWTINDKIDTTEITKLTTDELICRDNDGTTAKFKRIPTILGKWELTAEVAGIPKGSVFDFQKDGKLVITTTVQGQKQTFEFGYKLNGKLLELIIGDTKDTTEVTKLTADELICRDNDGTTAKFKRVK